MVAKLTTTKVKMLKTVKLDGKHYIGGSVYDVSGDIVRKLKDMSAIEVAASSEKAINPLEKGLSRASPPLEAGNEASKVIDPEALEIFEDPETDSEAEEEAAANNDEDGEEAEEPEEQEEEEEDEDEEKPTPRRTRTAKKKSRR
jgi:hypothetical protein